MEEIIFLVDNKKYFFKYIKEDSIKTIYKKTNIILNILRKFIYKFKLPLYSLFFDDWIKNIKDYKIVVILDTSYRRQIAKYIKKKNKDCKVIFYYWNLINKNDKNRMKNYKFLKEKKIDEFWSFNLEDCKKYGMKYNPQFYTKEIKIEDTNDINKKYDILFLGKNKNRKNKILKLREELKKINVKTEFKIIEKTKEMILYDEYLKSIGETKALLDIINDNETGLTLRCMESIFFNKKLITNNKDIINYDFYDKNNIFLLGEDDFKEISNFIKSEYKENKKNILEYYDYSNWIKRFDDN